MTHRIPRTIRYRGKVYRGWQALADDYGLSVFCTRNRIDRGIPLDLPKQKNGARLLNQPVEYDGRKYPSMRALAEAYGLRRDTLNLRLKKHIPLDLPRYAKKAANYRSIDYRGVTYKSLGALAKAFGLKKQTCGMRLLRHIPLDRPLRKGALKPCEYQGRRYESLKDFARDNDIRYEDAHICIDACGRWLDEKE